jgi:hypothetical protein
MLIKLNLTLPTFARQERVKQQDKPLTRQQWINIDRIVMAVLFLGAIAGAVIFS